MSRGRDATLDLVPTFCVLISTHAGARGRLQLHPDRQPSCISEYLHHHVTLTLDEEQQQQLSVCQFASTLDCYKPLLQVHEEEWSYIPVGGPLPVNSQAVTAFGAAANLVHPATGFSVSRSLRQAPEFAEVATAALQGGGSAADVSSAVWASLWSQERRQQVNMAVTAEKYSTMCPWGWSS